MQISGLTPETQYTLTIPGGLLIDDDNNSVGEIKILLRPKLYRLTKRRIMLVWKTMLMRCLRK